MYGHSTSTKVPRAVLSVICDTVNAAHGYRFWMARAEVCKRAGWSDRAVTDALAWLVDAGELVRDARGRPGRTAEYSFPAPVLEMFALYRLQARAKHPHDTPKHPHETPAFHAGDAGPTTTEHEPNPGPALTRAEQVAQVRAIRANR